VQLPVALFTSDRSLHMCKMIYSKCHLCRFHMFNASRQPDTVTNAQTGDEELFARPFDVRMPRVRLDVDVLLGYCYFCHIGCVFA